MTMGRQAECFIDGSKYTIYRTSLVLSQTANIEVPPADVEAITRVSGQILNTRLRIARRAAAFVLAAVNQLQPNELAGTREISACQPCPTSQRRTIQHDANTNRPDDTNDQSSNERDRRFPERLGERGDANAPLSWDCRLNNASRWRCQSDCPFHPHVHVQRSARSCCDIRP